MTWEFSVLDFIQTHLRSEAGDAVMLHITNSGRIWILLALAMLLHPKTRKTGAALVVALAVQLLIPRPSDFSFPSGHTGTSFAAASALYFSGCRLRVPALVFAALMGFTRLYLYVHYPSDVLAGAALGMFLGWLSCALVRFVERKFCRRDRSASL